jgi:TolA-binding protein
MNLQGGILLMAALAVAPVLRADIIVTSALVHTGEVLRVDDEGVTVKLPSMGEVKVYRADILSVEIPKPAGLDGAAKALQAGSFREAVDSLKPIIERYAGLDLPWIQEAMLRLADAYLGAQDFAAARATLEQFAKSYPQSPQATGVEVKYARVLFDQKNYAKAVEQLHEFLAPLLKRDYLTDAQEDAVSGGLLLLGDSQRAQGQTEPALDSYLAVVTMFDVNPDRVTEARYKAGQTFEELKNWKRAKDTYKELLAGAPRVAFASDVQKRLTELAKEHPE